MSWIVNTLAVLVGLVSCVLCQSESYIERCSDIEQADYMMSTYASFNYGTATYYEDFVQCTVYFRTTLDDVIIKLEGIDVRLIAGSGCDEKISILDGIALNDKEIYTSCSNDKLEVTSSGKILTLIYTFKRNSNGFKLRYKVIPIDEEHEHEDGLSSGGIAAVCATSAICVFMVICIAAKACKSRKKLKEDLETRGYTTDDLQLTQMTMLYKARSSQLTITIMSRGQQVTHQARVVEVRKAVQDWTNQGMIADPNDPLQMSVQEHMDQFATQRRRNETQNSHRVRHPAGDIHASQEQYPLNPISPVPSVDVSHHPSDNRHHHHHHPSPYTDIRGSNNNLSTDSNSNPNPSYLNGQNFPSNSLDRRSPQHHHRHHNPSPQPIMGSNNNLPTNNNSIPNINYLNGQNFPSNPSLSNSLDRRSPRHLQDQGSMSNMLTYYGVVDGDGAMTPVSPQASSQHQLEEPPPSYDEVTAGGKLSPYNRS